MRRKEQYIVRLDEVIITREGDAAHIQYKEPDVPSTHLQIGPALSGMSDEEIVELFNDTLRARAQLAASSPHVAVEVPLGSPQIAMCATFRPKNISNPEMSVSSRLCFDNLVYQNPQLAHEGQTRRCSAAQILGKAAALPCQLKSLWGQARNLDLHEPAVIKTEFVQIRRGPGTS